MKNTLATLRVETRRVSVGHRVVRCIGVAMPGTQSIHVPLVAIAAMPQEITLRTDDDSSDIRWNRDCQVEARRAPKVEEREQATRDREDDSVATPLLFDVVNEFHAAIQSCMDVHLIFFWCALRPQIDQSIW